jgi:hypothetical protein
METFNNVLPIRRERSWRHNGRLLVLSDSTLDTPWAPVGNAFSIDFPAMPESIELARSAVYKVQANMVFPDGIHVYESTSPQEIPFSFKIHHGDHDYCQEGPLTLLKLAARLHSLVIPLGDSDEPVEVKNNRPLDPETGNPQTEAAPAPKGDANVGMGAGQATSAQQGGNATFTATASTRATDPPVVVRLELINAGIDAPGINCTGYVKDVKVTLLGPWLRGQGLLSNLPSAGEYSFTFVHLPGHGNYYSNPSKQAYATLQAQAYAQFIRERLYNSRSLQTSAQYRGWVIPGQ